VLRPTVLLFSILSGIFVRRLMPTPAVPIFVQRIVRRPCVCQLFDQLFDMRGSYWNEGDLHKHMTTARRKFMPVKEIARYMVQLLRGLAHLHKHKVVHCDVSPQNVFLRRDREVSS
jgi:tRNA A-37 threonylcarbamoyl transferase component Bud32